MYNKLFEVYEECILGNWNSYLVQKVNFKLLSEKMRVHALNRGFCPAVPINFYFACQFEIDEYYID